MAARTNATERRTPTATSGGLLRPDEFARYAGLTRTACDPALADWVENHWTLTWDLPAGREFPSQVIAHPTCTLSAELGHPRAGVGADRVVLTGVVSRRFDVRIAGNGWVHGVKFRPGGLAAFAGCDVAAFTDRTVPAASVLPAGVVAAMRGLTAGTDPAEAAATADAALHAARPSEPDPGYQLVLALIADMLADRTLVRVGQLEERHGVGRRRIERLFARYVGIGPKWVLARYRMHDVVAVLDGGFDGSLADLAASHGWYDQAHFTRDFTRLVGMTPGEYRAGSR